jgi:uncharacterized protein (DUF488 family)
MHYESGQSAASPAGVSQLFTVGYQGKAVADLIDVLGANGVTTVIDVRLVAWSRKKGFSRTALSEALASAGVRYEHWRELGNPPEIRDLFKDGQIAEGRLRFRETLRNGKSSVIADLAGLATRESVALLCLEADHTRCHRDVVADEAALRTQYALAVSHL